MNVFFTIKTSVVRDAALALADPFELYKPLPPFDEKSVATSNLKDPKKIEEKINKAREAYPQKVAEHEAEYERKKLEYEVKAINKARGNALCATVSAIGVKIGNSIEIIKGHEIDILKIFWAKYFQGEYETFVGFDCLNVSVPFLLRRSWVLGVIAPNIVNGKFLNGKFVDVLTAFSAGVYGYKESLDNLARFFDIDLYKGDIASDMFDNALYGDDEIKQQQAEGLVKSELEAIEKIAEKIGIIRKEVENEFC